MTALGPKIWYWEYTKRPHRLIELIPASVPYNISCFMAININWENENGGIIESWEDWCLPWDAYVGTFEIPETAEMLEKTCCLRFIDHYGDTTFNQFQIPILISELEVLLAVYKDPESRQGVESLVKFLKKTEGNIHTYVKFWGD